MQGHKYISGQAIQLDGYSHSKAERLIVILQLANEVWLTLTGGAERDGLIAAVAPASQGRFSCSKPA